MVRNLALTPRPGHKQTTLSNVQAPLALHCVVIGAGAIGLASAIALARVGHRVVLLEQAPDLDHVRPLPFHLSRMEGAETDSAHQIQTAGFAAPPNLTKVLFKWGLRDALEVFTKPWHATGFLQCASRAVRLSESCARTDAHAAGVTGEEYSTNSWDQEAVRESGGNWALSEVSTAPARRFIPRLMCRLPEVPCVPPLHGRDRASEWR